MERTLSTTIDLKHQMPESDTNKYITEITDKGINVHPDKDNSWKVQISDGVYIIDDTNGQDKSVAKYKDAITLGNDDGTESYQLLDYHSLQLFDYDNPESYFHISDLRKKNDDWQATITETFTGDGETKDFDVGLPVSEEVSAVDSSHPSEIATRNNQRYTFTIPPDDGATITIVYKTRSNLAKAYTFGYRLPQSKIGPMSVAEGYKTTASGRYSHAEGCKTTASGSCSHAEGFGNKAIGFSSHAEGGGIMESGGTMPGSTASGFCSHAEGSKTTSSGIYSHAEGYGTTASSFSSHAEGDGAEASGPNSHAQNSYTIAGYRAQTAIGRYNKNKWNTAFEIGNGSEDTDEERSNAFEVYWDGKVISSGAFHTENSSNGNAVELQVGSGGTNRGVYIPGVGWMIYYDGSKTRINNLAVDSGSCTIASGWANYESGQAPIIRKQGNVVSFYWQCKPTSSITIDATRRTVCTIPSGYRPPRIISKICQGTGTRIFEMTVQTNGNVQVARLRNTNSTSYDTADSSYWFPLHMTWITD